MGGYVMIGDGERPSGGTDRKARMCRDMANEARRALRLREGLDRSRRTDECRQLAAGRHAWAVTPGAAGPLVTCGACGAASPAETARLEVAAGHVAVVTLLG